MIGCANISRASNLGQVTFLNTMHNLSALIANSMIYAWIHVGRV